MNLFTKYIDLANNVSYNNVESNQHIQHLHSNHHLVLNLFIFEKCDCRPFSNYQNIKDMWPYNGNVIVNNPNESASDLLLNCIKSILLKNSLRTNNCALYL